MSPRAAVSLPGNLRATSHPSFYRVDRKSCNHYGFENSEGQPAKLLFVFGTPKSSWILAPYLSVKVSIAAFGSRTRRRANK